VAQLLCDQLEFANVIVLNKVDLLSANERHKLCAVLRRINQVCGVVWCGVAWCCGVFSMCFFVCLWVWTCVHVCGTTDQCADAGAYIYQVALILEASYGRVPLDRILGTNLFDLARASQHPEWLKEARIGEHTPETVECVVPRVQHYTPARQSTALPACKAKRATYVCVSCVSVCVVSLCASALVWMHRYGISAFTYRSRRPFHPQRLRELAMVMEQSRDLVEDAPTPTTSATTAATTTTTTTSAISGGGGNSTSSSTSSVTAAATISSSSISAATTAPSSSPSSSSPSSSPSSSSPSSSSPSSVYEPARSVVRAKGSMWLASKDGHERQAVVSLAGRRFTVLPGARWWAAIEWYVLLLFVAGVRPSY
jgi:G3E family GTPase